MKRPRTIHLRPLVLVLSIGATVTALCPSALGQTTYFRRGDANNDAEINVADPVATLLFLFADGGPLSCRDAADANDDGWVDISDALATLQFLFGDGPPLAAPGVDSCGPDETPDALDCLVYDDCPTAGALIRVASTSPRHREAGVALTHETVITFSSPIDPATVTAGAIFGTFAGETLPSRRHVFGDGTRVTLFWGSPLPAAARVRVTILGERLLSATGAAVDADRDGEPGGSFVFDFDTLGITPLDANVVVGRVFASELDDGGMEVPLAGVVITVDGTESTATPLRATTDAMGNFRLEGAPQGRFFVHIDGRPVTGGFPGGDYYPNVGKAWETGTSRDRVTNIGDVFLPLVEAGTLQPVSAAADTEIGFTPRVVERFPELEGVSLTVPAGSLFSDDGTSGGLVGIAPVAPDRLPGTLPPGLEFPLVITVQTDGATNFDVPAPVCFPNLPDPATGDRREPNEEAFLYSFDHDKGRFEPVGSMTVSPDGELICTDPGVGIRAPGWHGVEEEPDETDDCTDPCCAKSEGGAIDLLPLLDCFIDDDGRNCDDDLFDLCRDCTDRATGKREEWCESNRNSRFQERRTREFRRNGESFDDYCRRRTGEQADAELQRCADAFAECGAERGRAGGVAVPEILAGIRSLHDEIAGLLAPFSDADELPADIDREVAGLLAAADEIAGGSVREFLDARILEAQMALDAGAAELGARPGEAPVEPLLYAAEIARSDGRLLEVRGETGSFAKVVIFVPRDGRLLNVVFLDPRTGALDVVNPRLDGNRLPFPVLLPPPAGLSDGDGDGLVDLVEFVYGSHPDNPDSDGDGIPDGAEVEQGTNPLDGLPVRTGVVASVDTPGTAVGVCAVDDVAVVADSEAGVSVFNVFQGMEPRIVAQVDTPGRATAVACSGTRIAVADGPAGVALIDISDPPAASIVEQIPLRGDTRAVVASGPLAWIGTTLAPELVVVDLRTGTVLESLAIGAPVEDLAIEGDVLYVLTASELKAVPLFDAALRESGFASFGGGLTADQRARLFVGGGIAYATATNGYATYDLANPRQPVLFSDPTSQQAGWRHVAVNGSGSGVAAVATDADEARDVELYDVSDPAATDAFLTLRNAR